jgi:hypothetical protein
MNRLEPLQDQTLPSGLRPYKYCQIAEFDRRVLNLGKFSNLQNWHGTSLTRGSMRFGEFHSTVVQDSSPVEQHPRSMSSGIVGQSDGAHLIDDIGKGRRISAQQPGANSHSTELRDIVREKTCASSSEH